MTVLIFIGALLGTMAFGVPIAYALLLSGVALMFHMDLLDAQILAQAVINGADNFPLLAVPFFMLAGEIMNVGGLSKRIVNFALCLVGHKRGGLGFVAIIAATLMAALSGSAVADTAALGSLLLPMMVSAGYNRGRSAGLLAAGGIIAPIIPPSIAFIIFGVAANLSITRLFMAGIFPGLMMATFLSVTWYVVAGKEGLVPMEKPAKGMLWQSFRTSVWALFLPVIIIVGLRMGVFTPTEAAVVAAVYALFVAAVIYRELTLKQLYQVIVGAGKTTSVIMFLVASAMVSAWLVTVAEIPLKLVEMLTPFMGSPTILLVAIMILALLIGMAMDMTPIILIMTPVLMPVIKSAGIDPIYFGVLFVMNCSLGLITPPVGTVLNTICGVGKLKMEDAVRGVFPFLMAEVAVMFLLVCFPQLVIVPGRWLYGG